MKTGVRHEEVGPADAPHRLRIAHLSDFHLWFSWRKLEAMEEVIAAEQPDVLALTGDYADTPRGQRLATDWLARMARRHPVCWVAGNHDGWWGGAFLRRLHALPEAHAIDRRDAWISAPGGRRYRFTSLARMAEPGPDAGEPTIVLLHDPQVVTAAPHLDANTLLLAGHLHGGQIVLWRDRRGWPQPVAWFYRWQLERTAVGAATLIVSRGLGETLPLRLGASREIVIVDFRA